MYDDELLRKISQSTLIFLIAKEVGINEKVWGAKVPEFNERIIGNKQGGEDFLENVE